MRNMFTWIYDNTITPIHNNKVTAGCFLMSIVCVSTGVAIPAAFFLGAGLMNGLNKSNNNGKPSADICLKQATQQTVRVEHVDQQQNQKLQAALERGKGLELELEQKNASISDLTDEIKTLKREKNELQLKLGEGCNINPAETKSDRDPYKGSAGKDKAKSSEKKPDSPLVKAGSFSDVRKRKKPSNSSISSLKL
jgi:hypothetical protein